MNKKLTKLETEKEERDKELNDLYIIQNTLEEELRAIKNNIDNYKEQIEDLNNIKLKLPNSLKKGILISLIPIIIALIVGVLGNIVFYCITNTSVPIIYFTILSGLMLTPAAVLVGTKEYFDLKKILKNSDVEVLETILQKEKKIKKIVENEYSENKHQIKKYQDEIIILNLCIEEILNPNLTKEKIIEVVEELGNQKIKS